MLSILTTSVAAWTINDTTIRSVGLGSQFDITYPIVLENLTIASDFIYFANLNSSHPSNNGNYTITFNFTEQNITYSGLDLPYVIQEELETMIYSNLNASTSVLFGLKIDNCEILTGMNYQSASNNFNKAVLNLPCVNDYALINITLQKGTNILTHYYNDTQPVINSSRLISLSTSTTLLEYCNAIELNSNLVKYYYQLYLNGNLIEQNDFCYQEFANVSTCDGLGSYGAMSGTGTSDAYKITDGNYNTYFVQEGLGAGEKEIHSLSILQFQVML